MSSYWIVEFIFNWQQLVGAIIGGVVGAIIAVSSILFNERLRNKRERKKQYYSLLDVLYELQYFISRCETYLSHRKENNNSIPRNTIMLKNKVYWRHEMLNLNSDVITLAQDLYKRAQETKYNIEGIKDKISAEEVENFIKSYMKDNYERFNKVFIGMRKTAKDYKINFPSSIKYYSEGYISKKASEYGLNSSNNS